jgi:hypothetical protein
VGRNNTVSVVGALDASVREIGAEDPNTAWQRHADSPGEGLGGHVTCRGHLDVHAAIGAVRTSGAANITQADSTIGGCDVGGTA